jgi:hypothetical protein
VAGKRPGYPVLGRRGNQRNRHRTTAPHGWARPLTFRLSGRHLCSLRQSAA